MGLLPLAMGDQRNTRVFEDHHNWQATVKISEGDIFFLMRGQPGSEYAGKFFLYRHDWDPKVDRNPPGYQAEEITAYSPSIASY